MHYNHRITLSDRLHTMDFYFIISAQLVEAPCSFTAPPTLPFSNSLTASRMHPYGLHMHVWLIYFDYPVARLNQTWTTLWPKRKHWTCIYFYPLKHLCPHTCAHTRFPVCSVTLTWVGFPAVQAVSSINMCLLAGDHYVCITGRQ